MKKMNIEKNIEEVQIFLGKIFAAMNIVRERDFVCIFFLFQ